MKTGYFFIIKNKMTRGKELSQLLHAGELLFKKEGATQKKIVYKIPVEEVPLLLSFFKKNNLNYYEIIDAGKTQVPIGTRTIITISLDDEETTFFKNYKLY